MRKVSKRRMPGGWAPDMEKRAADQKDRQVKCLIASGGHLWMKDYYDELPPVVRRRLAQSPFNICAACMMIEAQSAGRPTVASYLSLIQEIERKLRCEEV
jgi:hypothetical protein